MNEVIIRPATMEDNEDLYQLACAAGPGMTNFPPCYATLSERIEWSLRSFAKDVLEPNNEYYLFVMECQQTQKVIGCCAIFGKAGSQQPFYSYKISKEKIYSEVIEIDKWIEVLHLVHDYHETTEIGTLFLHEDYRKDKLGEFLSRVRFLFMACFKELFTERVIAEMRGVINDKGECPFWNALGKHFFSIDFMRADELCAMGKKQFIIDCMPRCPIYVPLLPQSAQAVMGEVHDDTRPAKTLLEKEGFHFEGFIDIFDAGPTMEAKVKQLHTVQNATVVDIGTIVRKLEAGKVYMICNQSKDFRACLASIQFHDDGLVAIEESTAKSLNVEKGRQLKIVEFPLSKTL